MFIYNVTVNLDPEIHNNDWLQWMRKVHIPDVMNTGCFTGSRILKVLFVNEEGPTYSVQYSFMTMKDIETYQRDFAPMLQTQHKKRFGDKYSAFRTVLEVCD